MKQVDRMLRVQELILAALSEVLRDDIGDEDLRSCTFTRVQAARDLSHARVWFLTHGDTEAEDLEKSFARAAGFIRACMGKRIDMKRTPELQFFYDATLDAGASLSIKLGQEGADGA